MTISRKRWLAKKTARNALMVSSWATGSLRARKHLMKGPTVRVLTYHRFGDVQSSGLYR